MGVACEGPEGSRARGPGLNLWLSTQNRGAPGTPTSLPSLGQLQPGRETLTASAEVCLGSAVQTRSGQQRAQLGKVMRSKLGELLFRREVPGAEDMIWGSGSCSWSVRGSGMCKKERACSGGVLSARPDRGARATFPPRTAGEVGARSPAGPSPSGSERAQLRRGPRPAPGCPSPGVQGFSSGPASPPGGRPALEWGRGTQAPPPRPAPANGPLCLLVFG